MGKIRITDIVIENFKGIKNFSLKCNEKTTICGRNAVGKSTILDAVYWCMFDKLADGSSATNIRPLDKDGNVIHDIEIKVSVTYDIETVPYTFTKLQKEIWTKHRGSINPVFEGNKNFFEINGYPKKDKDYKDIVSGIVNADVWKMMSDPRYFPSLPWKDQRKIVMNFYQALSDIEIVKQNRHFIGLLPDIQMADSLDDIKAKYTKALNAWKKQMAEIPVRIDELDKTKSDTDLSMLEAKKHDLETKIANFEKDKTQYDYSEDIKKLEDKRFEIQFALNDESRKANETLNVQKSELDDSIFSIRSDIRSAKSEIIDHERNIEDAEKEIAKIESEIKDHSAKFLDARKRKFDKVMEFDECKYALTDKDKICPCCGRELPADKIKQMVSDMNKRKAKDYADAVAEFDTGKREFEKQRMCDMNAQSQIVENLKSQMRADKAYIKSHKSEMAKVQKNLAKLNSTLEEVTNDRETLPKSADMSHNSKYLALKVDKDKLDVKISELCDKQKNAPDFGYEIKMCQNQLDEVKKEIAKASKNVEIDERIEDLKKLQRDVSQKSADQEKMLYLLEEFIKYKLDMISDIINKQFKNVRFKLFKEQINGGMAECCECTWNGVPFSSLNTGHRIIAGCEIIESLHNLYHCNTPVFIDNAECLSDGNLPSMDTQLIAMYVTNDTKLIIK